MNTRSQSSVEAITRFATILAKQLKENFVNVQAVQQNVKHQLVSDQLAARIESEVLEALIYASYTEKPVKDKEVFDYGMVQFPIIKELLAQYDKDKVLPKSCLALIGKLEVKGEFNFMNGKNAEATGWCALYFADLKKYDSCDDFKRSGIERKKYMFFEFVMTLAKHTKDEGYLTQLTLDSKQASDPTIDALRTTYNIFGTEVKKDTNRYQNYTQSLWSRPEAKETVTQTPQPVSALRK